MTDERCWMTDASTPLSTGASTPLSTGASTPLSTGASTPCLKDRQALRTGTSTSYQTAQVSIDRC
jgi:hypothetical protein